jgi:signal transduction histidine kinase
MMAILNFKARLSNAVSAFARTSVSVFRTSKPEAVSAKTKICTEFASALSGCNIFEIDQRSKVLETSDSFVAGSMLVERVHVADRPAFLLACSNALEANQQLILRMQMSGNAHFAQTSIKIQKHGDALFAAFRPVDEGKGHIHEVSRELAHELRAPLAAMVGLADALAQNQTCTEEMRKAYPELIASAGRSLIEMTGTILEAAGGETAKPDVKLGLVVKDCIALMQPLATQKSIVLFNRLPAIIATKSMSGGALRQILTNLISNAVKFSPSGASVEVSAVTSANGWTLIVTDNGDGIAPEDIARLGQKNFRSGNAVGIAGYGLGLSIVRRLVDEMGASISFESRPGKGTRVVISFPATTLVTFSEFQTQGTNEPALHTRFNKAAGEKHAAA